jgi:diguanylate cyclase (GGDEF)-like protein
VGGVPFLVWLLASLLLAHTGAAVTDLLAGGGGPSAAVVDLFAAAGVLLALVAARGRVDARNVQLSAAAAVTLAAIASGVRGAAAGQPWFGVDVVLVVFAALALASRRDVVVSLTTGVLGWSGALVVGALVQSAPHRPSAASWALLFVLLTAAAAAAAAVRLQLATLQAAFAAASELAELQAVSDSTTGANNRRGLELLALPMIEHARRQGEAVHCLFIDLDDFRNVNEQLGRSHGDVVLTAACEAVLASVRATDVVARWSGDQFVVVGPGTGTSPLEMERRVRGQLAAEPPAPKEIWAGRVSIGAATLVPWDEGNLDSLLGRAEEDMQLRRSLRRQSRDRDRSAPLQAPVGPSTERRAKPPTTPPTTPPASPTVQNDH